jgi:N-acetylglutamate synthase-like GNAT family acetyltransferase
LRILMKPVFRLVDLARDGEAAFQLQVEYMTWVANGLAVCRQVPPPHPRSVEKYVAGSLGEVCGKAPPQGAFYLVEVNGELAGMCGLRKVASAVAEFKRIYVRPSHRGLRLGEAMMQRLLADAVAFGCEKAVLDSAPFMASAHRLYAAAGFVECPPYEGSEAPADLLAVWRFMERRLSGAVVGL